MNKDLRDWFLTAGTIIATGLLLLFAIPPVEYAFKMWEAYWK